MMFIQLEKSLLWSVNVRSVICSAPDVSLDMCTSLCIEGACPSLLERDQGSVLQAGFGVSEVSSGLTLGFSPTTMVHFLLGHITMVTVLEQFKSSDHIMSILQPLTNQITGKKIQDPDMDKKSE